MVTSESEVAYQAVDAAGWERLVRERDLRAALRTCGVPVPPILREDAGQRLQVQHRAPGVMGPEEVERRLFGRDPEGLDRYDPETPLTPWGSALAESLGGVLARVHDTPTTHLVLEEVARVDWERVLEVLDVHAPELRDTAEHVARWDRSLPAPTVLVHGDPHFGNLGIDPESGRVVALVDFDEAGLGHRLDDLKFLASEGPRFVETAVDAYERASGTSVDRHALALFHLRSAFEHLVHVEADRPRFPRMVRWAREAAVAAGLVERAV